jgi:hypothetical protein
MIRTVETLRLYALLYSVPLALVWALRLPPWTGAPLAAGLALLSLYYLTLSARTDVRAGRTPRLGLAVDREELDRETLEAAPAVFAVGAIVMGLVLLVAEPLQGALMLALVAAAAWRARLPVRDRHFLIEYAAPGAVLIAPATLLRAGDQIAPHVYAATWLTAATLGLAILLCLVRDRGEDRALAARTTATRLTRDGARALATVWIVAIPTLAMYGSVGDWWAWLATLIFVWMAFGALACLWASRPGWAASIVTLAGGLACTIVALTVA